MTGDSAGRPAGWLAPAALLPGEGTGCLASGPRQTRACRRPCIHASAASAGTGPGLWPAPYSSASCNPVTHTHSVNASVDDLDQNVPAAAFTAL